MSKAVVVRYDQGSSNLTTWYGTDHHKSDKIMMMIGTNNNVLTITSSVTAFNP